MKILLVTQYFPKGKDLKFSGGVEARTYFVGKYLAKKHKVFVLCTHQHGAKRSETIGGVKIFRVGPTMAYSAGSGRINPVTLAMFIVKAIYKGIKLQPDIIDGGNFTSHFIAKQISIFTRKPVVYWYPDVFIGIWVKTSGILSGFVGWACENFNLKLGASKFIAISSTTKEKLKKYRIPEAKITVIPCGIDKNEFSPGKTKENITIINVGRLVPYKKTADLIWAFAALRKHGIKAKLSIVGQGPEKNNLINLIKMLKLTREVTINGNLPRKDLVKKIKESYIFTMPSEIEGFGISTIEAAAAGVPYVVSDIPVFREVTKNGTGGLLFKTGNILDLTNQLKKLITSKKLYNQKSKEALKLAENYNWKTIATQTENVYSKLVLNK